MRRRPRVPGRQTHESLLSRLGAAAILRLRGSDTAAERGECGRSELHLARRRSQLWRVRRTVPIPSTESPSDLVSCTNASTSLDNSTFATATGPTATQITMVLGTSGDSIVDPVTLQNGSADYVGTLSGGTITTSQSGASANSVVSSPLNFSSADTALTSAASEFASLTTSTGTISGTTTLDLTGTLSGTNVFNLTTTVLKAATTIAISVPSGASVLINVTGSSYSGSKQSVTLRGGAPQRRCTGISREDR